MMIPNGYEINVAKMSTNYTGRKGYRHYCRIELSEGFDKDALDRFNELNEMFQANGDFHLELTKVTCYGTRIADSGKGESI